MTAGVYSSCAWECKRNALGEVIKPLETSQKIDKVMVKILREKCGSALNDSIVKCLGMALNFKSTKVDKVNKMGKNIRISSVSLEP